MLYLNEDDRKNIHFAPKTGFYSKEVTPSESFLRTALVLQEIQNNIRTLQRSISDRPINYLANEADLEEVWEKVGALVKSVPQQGGESVEPTPSVPDIAVVTNTPSRRPYKRKV